MTSPRMTLRLGLVRRVSDDQFKPTKKNGQLRAETYRLGFIRRHESQQAPHFIFQLADMAIEQRHV